ncbi:MAG: type VI secretion system baseplate subunit TssE [Pyrinomonadaceae bacterium]
MRRTDSDIRVTPSVLDRLVDLEPKESREAPKSRSTSLVELKQAVRRDLEWLLNTRCFLDSDEIDLPEAKCSVAFYGLPDITGMSAKSPAEQKRLAVAVETAIRNFEPRFVDLKVTLEPPSALDRQMRFRIEASLDMEPAPEPISFDTVLEIGSGDFAVNEK